MRYVCSLRKGLYLLFLVWTWITPISDAFVPPLDSKQVLPTSFTLFGGATSSDHSSPRMGELTSPEQKVYDLLTELHVSKYPFRVVVVGSGAILEATHELGPVLKISQQPSTGANLMTLASEDKSFEFHVRLSHVSKMVLTVKTSPNKVLRIVRLLNSSGESLASLILATDAEDATKWFSDLIDKHGDEIQL